MLLWTGVGKKSRQLGERLDGLEKRLARVEGFEGELLRISSCTESLATRKELSDRLQSVYGQLTAQQGSVYELQVWGKEITQVQATVQERLREELPAIIRAEASKLTQDMLQGLGLTDARPKLEQIPQMKQDLRELATETRLKWSEYRMKWSAQQAQTEDHIREVLQTVQSLQGLHQDLSAEVAQKADMDFMERKMLSNQQELERSAGHQVQEDVRSAIAELRAAVLRQEAARSEIAELRAELHRKGARADDARDETPKASARGLAELERLAETLRENDCETRGRLEAAEQVVGRLEAMREEDRRELSSMVRAERLEQALADARAETSKSMQVGDFDFKDAMLTLQFQQRELERTAAGFDEELRKGLETARRQADERIALSEINLRDAFAQALMSQGKGMASPRAHLTPYEASPLELRAHVVHASARNKQRRRGRGVIAGGPPPEKPEQPEKVVSD